MICSSISEIWGRLGSITLFIWTFPIVKTHNSTQAFWKLFFLSSGALKPNLKPNSSEFGNELFPKCCGGGYCDNGKSHEVIKAV